MRPKKKVNLFEKTTQDFSRPGLTQHAGGWGIWLNPVWRDFLHDVPQFPRHLRPEHIKGLVGVQLAITLIRFEEIVVWLLIPLGEKKRKWLGQ